MNYERQIGDLIKIVHEKNTRMRPTKLSPTREDPCQIAEVHENGTVKTPRGGNREDIPITRIAPFLAKNNKISYNNLKLLLGIRKSWWRLKQPIVRVVYRLAVTCSLSGTCIL